MCVHVCGCVRACVHARVYVCVSVFVCVCVCLCVYVCVYVCKGGGGVMLVRHLCVQRVNFWCLEQSFFLSDCLFYAPWAQLRRGAQRPLFFVMMMMMITN